METNGTIKDIESNNDLHFNNVINCANNVFL